MTIYRLTNIDTGRHHHFSSLLKAQDFGTMLLNTRGPGLSAYGWVRHEKNFSAESPIGWQNNDGKVYLSIIPIEVE